MVKTICEKKIGNTTYELCCLKEGNKYIIYKWGESKTKNSFAKRVPKQAIFDNEREARIYLEKLC